MALPEKYQWLETIGTLPKLLASGLQYIGLKEIAGAKSNPVILDMARSLGVSDIYTNDDQSWCALFINHLIRINGKPPLDHKGDRYNILRAKWLANWGSPVVTGEEKLGDILVFQRPGGGHCGIYVAESENTYFCLGGNQRNSVSIIEISKSRLIAARNYYATSPPPSVKKYIIGSDGKLSTNEA